MFSEAAVCRRACSSGPSSAAPARTASSQVRARPCRVTQLMMTPQMAMTVTSPVQDQEWASTVSGESAPATRARVVRLTPAE